MEHYTSLFRNFAYLITVSTCLPLTNTNKINTYII